MVLLKNDDATLPFDPTKKTAVIGPLGDDQHDMLGPWWGQGKDERRRQRVRRASRPSRPGATFTQGCTLSNDEPPAYDPANDCTSADGFADAVAAAKAADQVVLALGETREMSGEADEPLRRSTCPVSSRSSSTRSRRPASRSWSCCSTAGR